MADNAGLARGRRPGGHALPETAIGAAAASYLRDLGWAVYAEVEARGLVGRPDLVGVRRPLVLIAECKVTMSLVLLRQVRSHLPRAHYVLAVTPPVHEAVAARALLAHWGAGWITVDAFGVSTEVEPRLHRRVAATWAARLCAAQKTWAIPGSSSGGYWTPFADTSRQVAAYVRAHPGASTREVIDAVAHHYRSAATARSALYRWAVAGTIRGVEIRDGSWWPTAGAADLREVPR